MHFGSQAIVLSCLIAASGCASEPVTHVGAQAERESVDERRWRRQPVPLPPLYMEFTTSAGNRLKMVTPLYWQVESPSYERYHFIPLFGHTADRRAGTSGGYALNWFWSSGPGREFLTFFPFFWRSQSPESETLVVGPMYRHESIRDDSRRSHTVLLPWLFSHESDSEGYDYWSVMFRLLGHEKQMFNGDERSRLWLLFFFRVPLA